MAENTSIEWCDHTFNPWIGCTKVSPGCAHCYAETRSKRTDGVQWGKGQPRKRTSPENWKLPLKWNRNAIAHAEFMEGQAERPRVFCASLADWLDDEVPIEWLADLLRLIYSTPYLDWLLLTKRPQNWATRIAECSNCFALTKEQDVAVWAWIANWHIIGRPPHNIWLGTTVEDQTRADERIPLLLSIPAKVRFLSCEPLLGPVNLELPTPGPDLAQGSGQAICQPLFIQSGIHWVIAGGESGPGARPMHPGWARSLRDQCAAASVPFLFKQWGEWVACEAVPEIPIINDESRMGYIEWHGKVHPIVDGPCSSYLIQRVGKKAAGRRLDGIEHNEFPGGAQ